jgi:hypothetical protein
MMGSPRTTLLAMLALAGLAASLHGEGPPTEAVPADAESARSGYAQFEHGQPHKVVDSVGWVFGIPKKIILWDRRAVNHRVSPETEQHLAEYLAANSLCTTKVRINQYDPVGEWRRLRANKEVGAGWRYTVGAFGIVTYTLIPGRMFGSDGYNPYTDTINVYSDIPCLAQEQGSYAKLVRARPHPGTYAALTALPIVQLWPEKQSKNDVLDYTLENGTPEQHEEATRVLYAEYGAEVGGQTSLLLGSNIPLTLAGAGIGHVAARLNGDPATNSEPPTPETEPAADAALTASQNNEVVPPTTKR